MLRDEFGLVVTDSHLDSMRAAIYERFRSDLKPIPGIARGARPHRAASAASPRRASSNASGCRWRSPAFVDLFEPHIFSASMVARGKPAPDLFLHVAREMGVAPENCTVIEDSPAGIAAAKEAGMRVFAFAGGSHAERAGLLAAFEAMRPDLVFDDMRDLPDLLAGADAQAVAGARRKLVCSVDVGTGSARAGIFDGRGNLLGRADYPIVMNRPQPGHAEHDSEDIWRAACAATRGALANAGAAAARSSASPSMRPARWSFATGTARSSASRPAAASAGTPSSGSTIARSPRPTTAPRPATACSTISAASCRPRCRRRS